MRKLCFGCGKLLREFPPIMVNTAYMDGGKCSLCEAIWYGNIESIYIWINNKIKGVEYAQCQNGFFIGYDKVS